MPAMADETETKISDGEEGIVEKDAKVLNFLDSLDSYLILMDTLSSTLRQVPIPSLNFDFYILFFVSSIQK